METGIRGTESASQAARSAFMMTVALERHLLHGDMATLRQGDKHREILGQTLNEYEFRIDRPRIVGGSAEEV